METVFVVSTNDGAIVKIFREVNDAYSFVDKFEAREQKLPDNFSYYKGVLFIDEYLVE